MAPESNIDYGITNLDLDLTVTVCELLSLNNNI